MRGRESVRITVPTFCLVEVVRRAELREEEVGVVEGRGGS